MDTILLTGLFAAFFTTFAFAPQSIKTIRTRNTEGISVVMYIMFLTGVTNGAIVIHTQRLKSDPGGNLLS
ncbi:TPA: PQ-loop repeat-containing protein [Escherichia coli]|nr:PQ-loop repeat-containing protein [Escherichia coli]